MDLVATCPKNFWNSWLDEGDAAGTSESGEEFAWWTRSLAALKSLQPGDRFYVVCNGKLRGWAPVTRVIQQEDSQCRPIFGVCRKGGAEACTIPQVIPSFRGLRKRWWEREEESSFPDWKEL
jgi:hypothetical protein